MYFGYPALSDMGILTANVAIIGILINRQNIMMSVIAIELMFYGLNLYLIGISIEISDIMGQIYSMFILALAAGEAALELRLSEKAPGIVLAFEVTDEQIAESYEDSITLKTALPWDQVQCALLAFQGDDELVWFATQEIELHLSEWK